MQSPPRSVSAVRAQIQADAKKMGIDDAYISVLVDTFYTRVRAHPLIGPVFDNAIGDDWDHHLARMKDFWASVAMNAGRYTGQPMPKHKKLTAGSPAAQPWHFKIWLALFQETLEETAPSPAVVLYFMERAERIAKSLELGMFGVPGVGTPKPGAPTP
ncbi:MAG: group III truncated hemoglobin [Pseudomonadota bacterium]